MADLKLKAEKRKEFGNKVKKLRREGMLPANIYGKDVKSQAVSVDVNDFRKTFKEAGETSIVELQLGKDKRPTLIHNVQIDPVTDFPIHADFLQVNLKKKVTSQIPIELVNESPAEKQALGTVVQYVDEVEVEALPRDLPDNFEIDLSELEKVDDAIQVKDIKSADKVEIKSDPDQIIVKVEPPREEEEEPAPAVEEVLEEEVEGAEEEKDTQTEETVQKEEEETSEEE